MTPEADPRSAAQWYRTLAKVIWLAAGVGLLLWFAKEILLVLLFGVLVLIYALALNPPVTWLEQRRVPRGLGTVLVSLVIAAALGLVLWLILPRLVQELTGLLGQLPAYFALLTDRLAGLADRFAPQLGADLRLKLDASTLGRLLPTIQVWLSHVGSLTLSFVSGVLLLIIFVSTVLYAVARPRPLLRGYLAIFPPQLRLPAQRALIRCGRVVVGYVWSNVIVGAIEAVLVGIVLSLLGVPGALVWAGLAFFSELIPRFGGYVMAIPPVLVALAISPLTALWVWLFYIAMSELMGSVVVPYVRADSMNLHPASIMLAMLALGAAFGLLGALIATPMTGIVKAFYEEFHLFRRRGDVDANLAVEEVLDGRLDDLPSGTALAAERAEA